MASPEKIKDLLRKTQNLLPQKPRKGLTASWRKISLEQSLQEFCEQYDPAKNMRSVLDRAIEKGRTDDERAHIFHEALLAEDGRWVESRMDAAISVVHAMTPSLREAFTACVKKHGDLVQTLNEHTYFLQSLPACSGCTEFRIRQTVWEAGLDIVEALLILEGRRIS